MNYEIRELANNIIVQPKLHHCKIVIHSWLIHSSIYYLWLIPDESDNYLYGTWFLEVAQHHFVFI